MDRLLTSHRQFGMVFHRAGECLPVFRDHDEAAVRPRAPKARGCRAPIGTCLPRRSAHQTDHNPPPILMTCKLASPSPVVLESCESTNEASVAYGLTINFVDIYREPDSFKYPRKTSWTSRIVSNIP